MDIKRENEINQYGGLNLFYLNDYRNFSHTISFVTDKVSGNFLELDSTKAEKLEINNHK